MNSIWKNHGEFKQLFYKAEITVGGSVHGYMVEWDMRKDDEIKNIDVLIFSTYTPKDGWSWVIEVEAKKDRIPGGGCTIIRDAEMRIGIGWALA